MKLLSGKVALITGASRGIGKTIALEYARHGATVVFTYIGDEAPAAEVAALCSAKGVQVKYYSVDATDASATAACIDDVVATFGKLDILINNAGITKDGLLLRMSDEQFDMVLKVNLYSVFYSTRAAIRHMMKAKSGSIVNISSVVGVGGNAGQSNYAASKAGMIGFTKSTAKELGSRNIRANCIAPGFIATEMTDRLPKEEIDNWLKDIPLNRPGTTTDVANACVFLGSDLSTYISGHVLLVDGGMNM